MRLRDEHFNAANNLKDKTEEITFNEKLLNKDEKNTSRNFSVLLQKHNKKTDINLELTKNLNNLELTKNLNNQF